MLRIHEGGNGVKKVENHWVRQRRKKRWGEGEEKTGERKKERLCFWPGQCMVALLIKSKQD